MTLVLFSSVLSSTKNDSLLENANNTIVLSSDTENDDTDTDDEEEEEEGVEIASVSEVVDSSSSGMREVGDSTTSEATTPGTPLMPDMPSMPDSQAYVLNSAEQSSVTSVSQLSCDDTTLASSAGATLGDSSITILTAELASHPARLAEVVVEGLGERDQEEPLKERKRESSVGEIIEDTFRDKSIAASFGESASQKEEEEEPAEVEPSPSKRKSKGGGDGGEEEGQEVPVVGEVTVGGLPAKRQVYDYNL